MPALICDCGKVYHYRNTRGSRIAGMTCDCGKPLHAARYVPETNSYERRTDTSGKGLGRKKVACALCGRMRMSPSSNVKVLTADTTFLVYVGRDALAPTSTLLFAGSIVCWYHRAGDMQPYPIREE
jgi:hypothetical protein